MKINVLGTEYKTRTHKISKDETLKRNNWCGYCSCEEKVIVIADVTEDKYFPDMTDHERYLYRNKILRHEIIHAFLEESGLSDSTLTYDCAWSKNEEMIDWFAIQSPKIYKVFKEVGCI